MQLSGTLSCIIASITTAQFRQVLVSINLGFRYSQRLVCQLLI